MSFGTNNINISPDWQICDALAARQWGGPRGGGGNHGPHVPSKGRETLGKLVVRLFENTRMVKLILISLPAMKYPKRISIH
jgi:hypothetical protein